MFVYFYVMEVLLLNTRDKVKSIFLYLLSIKNMDKKIIREVSKYNKIIWELDLHNKKGCILHKNEEEEWLEVSKDCEELYSILFKIYSSLQKNSEDLELVWGHDLLSWNFNGEKILHPMFTTKMSLNFEPERGVFTLVPYNNITNMELGVLEGLDIPNFHKIMDVNLEVKNLGIDGRNLDSIEPLLNLLSHCLSDKSNKKFDRELISSSDIKITEEPTFYNCPSIILRNIDTRLWDSELNSILEYIDGNKPLPKSIEALVKEINSIEVNEDYREWEPIGRDILFPLPANEEQEEITKRLSKNFGVVVQGPPGTGKSHTIVNLICHLMAHGKRVLVTSQTDRALKVLSHKIPEEISSLCISLLGNDSKALKELDESVRRITENLSIDPNLLLKEVAPIEEELKRCRENIQRLMDELKEAESFENKTVNYKNETLSLTELGKWIRENKDRYSWIEDEIQIKTRCPLTSEEFDSLIKLIKKHKKDDIQELSQLEDSLYKIPEYNELTLKLDRIKALEKNMESYRKNIENWKINNTTEENDQLLDLIISGEEKIEEIEGCWLKSIMKSYYSGTSSQEFWKDTIKNLNSYIKDINKLKQDINTHSIKIPGNVDIHNLQRDFQVIEKYINSKGKIGSMFKLFHSQYNYILENCEVDHQPISTKEQCEVLGNAIQKEILERNLRNLWNNTVKEYGGKLVTHSDNGLLTTIAENVLQIETIINWEEDYKNKVEKALENSKLPLELNLYKKSGFEYLKKGLYSMAYIKEYESLTKLLQDWRKLFLKNEYLKEAADWISDYDKVNLRKLYDKLWKLKDIKVDAEKINRMMGKLEEVCPIFTKKLLAEWGDNNIRDHYNSWYDAWKWKAGTSLLKEVYKLSPERMEKDIEAEKIREKALIKEIVAKKTWYSQIIRTTESQKRSLFTWMESIKRIGKGTGKQAAKYRKLAQREMEKCKGVIPVWIMPLNKVIENIKLEDDLFDVVIMDESSQSDISAITALLRGKRAVVVGDEWQISPEAIGKDNEMVENLINRYLKEIPHAEWFDLKTSLYHTARRVFPSRLVLKEHFRCTKDIIGFSNNLCYSKEIIPLRCPERKENFSPSVCTVKIEDGLKDSSKNINVKEAEALVNKIVQCCNDEKYNNMTMGVISLLGESQSEYIENLLKEKLGIEEMIERRIICGDAYSFQGDERDVMFLSMVIANNAKFTALTKESDIRRFNVAASRARNRMFLFHSVNLEDLNPRCVRALLLDYCLNPDILSPYQVENEKLLVSGLKKDVYSLLKDKGYKVLNDVRVGRYKIDLVVEGLNSRLAVDCCGAETAYLSNWEESHNRRITLQRVGWNFFIIRESQFYYNPEETINKLYSQLKNMGITPIKKQN